jgi:hypothetical protein
MLGHVIGKRRDMTFLVRMWLNEEAAADGEWRGSVHEVTSGRRLFITQTRDVADFIAARLAETRRKKE